MAEPVTGFKCYLMSNGVQGAYCGGANDNASAAAIAASVYELAQTASASNSRGVGVWDPTGDLIAYIGRTPP